MYRTTTRRAALLATAAFTLAACGGSTTSAAAEDPSGSTPSEITAGTVSPLPMIDVRNVVTEETVALADLVPADKPTLLWMWAPH